MTKIVDYKPVTPSPGQPMWAAVRDAVRDVIDSGRVGPGDRLPSTKAISETMSVSLVTVHRALQELVAAGVLRRGQGRGTFVHEAYLSPDRKSTGLRLGLVIHAEASLANPYYSPIMDGIRRASHAEGVDLVFLRYGEDWRNECDGLIYVNPSREQLAMPPRFGSTNGRAGNPPLMQIGASFEADGFGWIDADNIEIGRRAAVELHRAGHRRIGLVGEKPTLSNSLDRERGFKRAALDLGVLRRDSDCVRSDGWRLDAGGRRRLRDLLVSDDRPSALFASGYYFALDVYDTARDLGLSIPGDIAVLGVDDPPSATHLAPALSTFRQPLEEMGELVIREQIRSIRGETGRPARRTLDAAFVPRASHLRPGVTPSFGNA
jgi:DNA-binding LacI/PurR family transcriptional regulator